MSLIRSKERVANHGEVFTPPWLVSAMLDLVKEETERIDSRFLEPACGSGNFLVEVMRRKLAAVEVKYGGNEFERSQYALLALMSIYGIELLHDNIIECRANLLEIFAEYLSVDEGSNPYRAASYVLSLNLVHGNAMTMKGHDHHPIMFAEWGYLGKGKFQRRDFELEILTQAAEFSKNSTTKQTGSLWHDRGKEDIFKPVRTFRPMTVADMALIELGAAVAETQ